MDEYAVVILVFIVAADKLLDFFKRRGIDLQKMAKQVDTLYEWHDHDDPDEVGVKIWWNRKYIADLIKTLTESQQTQTELIKEMRRELRQKHSNIRRSP